MTSSKFVLLTALCILTACGGNGGGSSSGASSNPAVRETQEMIEAAPGTYYTVLRPVNFRSNGFIPYGMATFTMKDDVLSASISVDDDQPVPHRQYLHSGSRCPTLADDTNGDGFIDYDEAQRVVGGVIMPLDADLNGQRAGQDIFAKGPAMTYSKVASLSRINADLLSADEDPSDNIMKLSGKGIAFAGRVVVVHGTAPHPAFPTSLSAYKTEPAYLSLPILCGVLDKVE